MKNKYAPYLLEGKKKKIKDNKRGQLSFDNIIFWVILVIVSVVVTPVARGFINTAITETNNTLEIFVLNSILPIYWLLLIIVLLRYARPENQQMF